MTATGGAPGLNPLAELQRVVSQKQRSITATIVSSGYGQSVVRTASGREMTVQGAGRPGDLAIVVEGRIVATMPSAGPMFAVVV